VRDTLALHRDAAAAERALVLRHKALATRPFAKAVVACTSQTAILLSRVGLATLSTWLMKRSLYPSGSVGRVSRNS